MTGGGGATANHRNITDQAFRILNHASSTSTQISHFDCATNKRDINNPFQNWYDTNAQCPLPSLFFPVRSCSQQRLPPWPVIDWGIFGLPSASAEQNLTKLKMVQVIMSSTKFLFFGWYVNKDGRHGLWFVETFSTSILQPLNGIWQNLKGNKYMYSASNKFD